MAIKYNNVQYYGVYLFSLSKCIDHTFFSYVTIYIFATGTVCFGVFLWVFCWPKWPNQDTKNTHIQEKTVFSIIRICLIHLFKKLFLVCLFCICKHWHSYVNFIYSIFFFFFTDYATWVFDMHMTSYCK